jgi:quercetin dioxygenase-like cupin family protein
MIFHALPFRPHHGRRRIGFATPRNHEGAAMHVHAAASLPESPIPGIAHATLASRGHGLESLSVWKQTIAAGQGTPPHRHDCEEVVVVLAGSGELLAGDARMPFSAGATLLLPANEDHQIVNSGAEPLTIVATFSATPVNTYAPCGAALELPWRS